MYNVKEIIKSWANEDGNINTTAEIRKWIDALNDTVQVDIKKNRLEDSDFWYYNEDSGSIVNKSNSFFSITGFRTVKDNNTIIEQPIIIQNEIGYLGIICKKIDGVLNFLMQAKIEPGNVNKIQISPTIQATKSNFTQKHGGSKPNYLDYFVNANGYDIIVDQIQSEQSSRFYKKRNRNIVIEVNDDVELLSSHKWMTLGQIKKLMEIDNIVNMDTRTVISCIPICPKNLSNIELENIKKYFVDGKLANSILNSYDNTMLSNIFNYSNDYKMFDNSKSQFVPLDSLSSWSMTEKEFICKNKHNFKVIFCDISIEGREVRRWTQPLFEATGYATFGLIMCNHNGSKKFLIHAHPETGCFDKIELGPSVQLEPVEIEKAGNYVTKLFLEKLKNKDNIKYNVVLSEEGGRFYREQNYNIIIEIDKDELQYVPKGYFWADYCTLNTLIQFSNCLNIQLRNLLSLLEVSK